MAYSMIDLFISNLKRYRQNIDKEFQAWYNLATTMAQTVDVQSCVPRPAKGCSRVRSNVENDCLKFYYKGAAAVAFLDDVV